MTTAADPEERARAIAVVVRAGYSEEQAAHVVDAEGPAHILELARQRARQRRQPRPRWDGACPQGDACVEPSCMEHGEAPCGDDDYCEDPLCAVHGEVLDD